MNIVILYDQTSLPNCSVWQFGPVNIATSYSISVALNALLTLMIVTRLFLLRKNLQVAMRAPVRVNGLYKVIVTLLIESCALYAVAFLLYIGTWAANSPLKYLFFPILCQTQVRVIPYSLSHVSIRMFLSNHDGEQVIAPFLIISRISDKTAKTNSVIISGTVGSRFSSPGNSTGGSGTLPGGYPRGSVDTSGKNDRELGVMVETTVNLHRDES